jgi:DNA-binding Lrp family transcriptional regulator
MTYELDSTDNRIIAELRRNARISLSDLATIVGLSRVTVRARMARLETQGAIMGYSVVLADDIRQHPVRGFMMLAIEGRGAERISRFLRGVPAVQAVHSTNGKWDMIVELGTETLQDLDRVLATIRKVVGVMASETSLLLSTQMTRRVS